MKNIINLFISMTFITLFFASCSDDFEGIKFDLRSPDNLVLSPGETATFQFDVSDDTGIAELSIMEPSLGINMEELYTPSQPEINYTFTVEIPEDQEVGSQITIDVEIVDEDNNELLEQIKISIEE